MPCQVCHSIPTQPLMRQVATTTPSCLAAARPLTPSPHEPATPHEPPASPSRREPAPALCGPYAAAGNAGPLSTTAPARHATAGLRPPPQPKPSALCPRPAAPRHDGPAARHAVSSGKVISMPTGGCPCIAVQCQHSARLSCTLTCEHLPLRFPWLQGTAGPPAVAATPPSLTPTHGPSSLAAPHGPPSLAAAHGPPALTAAHGPPALTTAHGPASLAAAHGAPTVATATPKPSWHEDGAWARAWLPPARCQGPAVGAWAPWWLPRAHGLRSQQPWRPATAGRSPRPAPGAWPHPQRSWRPGSGALARWKPQRARRQPTWQRWRHPHCGGAAACGGASIRFEGASGC